MLELCMGLGQLKAQDGVGQVGRIVFEPEPGETCFISTVEVLPAGRTWAGSCRHSTGLGLGWASKGRPVQCSALRAKNLEGYWQTRIIAHQILYGAHFLKGSIIRKSYF